MKQVHVLRIETQGGDKGLMVNIYSDYYGQKIKIPLANEPGDLTPALTTAKKHLENMGFTFANYCYGKPYSPHYLIADQFLPIE